MKTAKAEESKVHILGTLPEEERRCGIHSEAEEKLSKVHRRSIAWNRRDEMRDVLLEGSKVADLGANEVWSQHLSRMLPFCAIGREDAVAKKWPKAILSPIAQPPLLELCRLYCSQVLGLGLCRTISTLLVSPAVDDLAHS